ncbi:hypothetical protein LXA43DRAFT_1062342 [Ganoderma leucocontextum]|nr:hypothetical protein LXA43DRAFT_1062342 [Ganoderma leucocontextum]
MFKVSPMSPQGHSSSPKSSGTTKDWAAFLTYASYVRYLGKPKYPSPSPFVPPEVFEAICALRPQHTLLPNVLELGVDSLVFAIRVAAISWNHTSEAGEPSGTVAATLDILSDFRQLQELTLGGNSGPDDEPPAALLRYLRTEPQLIKFECYNIPLLMEGIAYLASLPTLRTVLICLPDTLSWSSHNLPDKPFSKTESFSLFSTVESYTAFAQRIALPYVHKFSISLTAVPAAGSFPVLFTSIRRQFHPSTLIGLTIKPGTGEPDPFVAEDALDDGVLVSSQHLRPLLDFSELRDVTVVPQWGFSFDDDFCHDMAKAWTHVQELRFAHETWCLHAPLATTVRALSYFAAYCPELRFLGIKFDAQSWVDEIPILQERKIPADYYDALRGKRSTCKVHELRAELQPIACPEQVALYILRLFPDLRWCWRAWHSSEDTEEEARWRASLGVMAEMREDGKRWNLVDEDAG